MFQRRLAVDPGLERVVPARQTTEPIATFRIRHHKMRSIEDEDKRVLDTVMFRDIMRIDR